MNTQYIAFLYQDQGSDAYNIIIPDVEGAFSYGDNFEHAVKMAKELLEISVENPDNPPIANELKYFTQEKLEELEIPTNAIPQIIEYVKPAKKRITVNLHISALNAIDNYMEQNGFKNRSAFLEDSALLRLSN